MCEEGRITHPLCWCMKSLFEGAERFEAQLSLSLTEINLLLFFFSFCGWVGWGVQIFCCFKMLWEELHIPCVGACSHFLRAYDVVSFINRNHSLFSFFLGVGWGSTFLIVSILCGTPVLKTSTLYESVWINPLPRTTPPSWSLFNPPPYSHKLV